MWPEARGSNATSGWNVRDLQSPFDRSDSSTMYDGSARLVAAALSFLYLKGEGSIYSPPVD